MITNLHVNLFFKPGVLGILKVATGYLLVN